MWYLEVINNGEKYQLEFDGSIATQLINPMFSDEISHSLQFTLKDTLVNRRALGYLNMPEIADNKSRELPCTIKADPLVFTGSVVVAYQGSGFSCYFKQNGDFWSAIKDKLLKDIPFDVVTFDPGTGYDEIFDYIDTFRDNAEHDFNFPIVINYKIAEKFPITVLMQYHTNLEDGLPGVHHPVIPFLFVRYIYETIFRKHGIDINKNAFFNTFLRKLCIPNNFLLNEFYLDTVNVTTVNNVIAIITNTSEPQVTTLKPHGLADNAFIKIAGIGTNPPVENRIFQIDLVDGLNFKILNEDFSSATEYNKLYTPSDALTKHNLANMPYSYDYMFLFHTERTPSNNWNVAYIYSDDYEGYGVARYYTSEAAWNLYPNDPNIATHSLNNLRFIIIESGSVSNIDEFIPQFPEDPPHHLYFDVDNGDYEGILIKLSDVQSEFKELNPANHVPELTIKDFLNQCKFTIGVIPFIRSAGCDIKTFKKIISSPAFEDISVVSQVIRDIENPNIDGYEMKMLPDSADNYIKEKLPMQSFESKYTLKDPVATKSALAYAGSETNDVRLVEDENCYYVFNKSFLNADNNWIFLTYNLLDLLLDNGDLKIETKFSTLLPNELSQAELAYVRFDVNCNCKPFDSEVQIAPRIVAYYGKFTIGELDYIVTKGEAWDESGIIPADVFSLRWEGEHGLKEKVFKEYIEWRLNVRKDCITLVQWPMKLLADFDFSKKYRIQAIDYLVKSIKFTLNFKTSQIEFNETELAKV